MCNEKACAVSFLWYRFLFNHIITKELDFYAMILGLLRDYEAVIKYNVYKFSSRIGFVIAISPCCSEHEQFYQIVAASLNRLSTPSAMYISNELPVISTTVLSVFCRRELPLPSYSLREPFYVMFTLDIAFPDKKSGFT